MKKSDLCVILVITFLVILYSEKMIANSLNISKINANVINGLARSYSPLDYPQKLRTLLSTVYPNTDYYGYSKLQLHKKINEILMTSYSGEEVIKYLLIKEFFKGNVTAAFELKVNNSRIDFLTINGDTKSFEIKSSLDNLRKLAKQANDYIKVFEYNYIAIDEKHLDGALKILPETYGIWIFKKNRKKIVRNATLNNKLDAALQLNLFTKKELNFFFEGNNNRESILDLYNTEVINGSFKKMLKKRYENKWSFIKENKSEILPIDFHFFYHNNISPNLIYGI